MALKSLTFSGMNRHSFIALILILVFVSHDCDASLVFHVRKLSATVPSNASTASQVTPTGSPAGQSNKTAAVTVKPGENTQKDTQVNNKTNATVALPNVTDNSNKNDKDDTNFGGSELPADAKGSNVIDRGNEKAANAGMPKLNSCKASCTDQMMLACIEASRGSKQFLVVQNEGETTLKVQVNLPNYLTSDLPAFEVAKHETERMDISSVVGKSTELIVDSGKAKCTLRMVRPVPVENLVEQLSFYSKQVTPVYAAYAFFLLALVFGGIWACCKLSKGNNYQQNGIPYQELEMGLPESIPAGTGDGAAEGWDHDWDDDDWNAGSIVKSPDRHHVRNVSVDSTSLRPSKKSGWEDDWED